MSLTVVTGALDFELLPFVLGGLGGKNTELVEVPLELFLELLLEDERVDVA